MLAPVHMPMEHDFVLGPLLYLPVAVVAFLFLMQLAAQAGLPGARAFLARYLAASSAVKLGVLLMLVSAAIHLALIPVHSDEPVTAALFGLDGLALIVVSALAFLTPIWRSLSLLLLVATVLAYFVYLAAGLETPDAIGVFTKVVELTAIGVIVIQNPGLLRSSQYKGQRRPAIS